MPRHATQPQAHNKPTYPYDLSSGSYPATLMRWLWCTTDNVANTAQRTCCVAFAATRCAGAPHHNGTIGSCCYTGCQLFPTEYLQHFCHHQGTCHALQISSSPQLPTQGDRDSRSPTATARVRASKTPFVPSTKNGAIAF